jgi:hypothetical protein
VAKKKGGSFGDQHSSIWERHVPYILIKTNHEAFYAKRTRRINIFNWS